MQDKGSLNFKDIVEQYPGSTIYTNNEFAIQYVNRAAEKLYGWEREDLIGRSAHSVFRSMEFPEDIKKDILNEVRSERTYKWEGWVQRKDGSRLFCKHIISPVQDKQNNICGYLESHTEITDQKGTEEKLRESEERLQTLYNNMPGGTLIIGRDYIIKDVNYRTCEITGFSREELVGQLCDILCPKGSASRKCPIWEEGSDGFHGMDTTIKCHDKQRKPIIKNAKVVTIEGKAYILENFQDISELKETQEELIMARMAAEDSNRAKSDFLATMSHELRTPLNSIIGFSELMGEEIYGDLNNKQKRYASNITNSGKHLLSLINNILDISKIEAGKMDLNCEHFTAREVFEDVQALVYPLSTKKDINVTTEVSPEDIEICADKTKIKQVMYNLLNNAIKFTPEGGSIHIAARHEHDRLSIDVTDTGIGIPFEKQQIIFEPFRQVDSAESRNYQGTGLGLALARQFIQLHNGTIEVESQLDRGSTFRIELPIRQTSDNYNMFCQ